MYDDHNYCDLEPGSCGKHAIDCWCWGSHPPVPVEQPKVCFIPNDHTDTPIYDQTRQALRRAV